MEPLAIAEISVIRAIGTIFLDCPSSKRRRQWIKFRVRRW